MTIKNNLTAVLLLASAAFYAQEITIQDTAASIKLRDLSGNYLKIQTPTLPGLLFNFVKVQQSPLFNKRDAVY